MASDVGVVVGLVAEARIVGKLGYPIAIAIGGGDAAGAEQAARRLVADGATALISFGLCGGLDPMLRPGALVVPYAVRDGEARFGADPALAARFGGFTPHLLLGGTRIAATIAEKQHLHLATGAAAIDLESGAVARVATAAGLPFAAVRAVCDPAGQNLPPAALIALNAKGAIGLIRVLSSVAARPGQLPALVTLASYAAAARRSLVRAMA